MAQLANLASMQKFFRFAAVAVMIALVAVSVPNTSIDSALGATPAGKSCSKKSATMTHEGKKYTCVVSNKKLVWNKGVLIKSPAKPSESQAPVPELKISANEKLAKDILEAFSRAESNTFKLEVRTCPQVNKAKSDETIKAYEDALRFWGALYNPQKPITWVMFSEKDYDCWLSNVNELESNYADTAVWNPTTSVMGHCSLSSNSFCGYGTGVKPNGALVQYNAIGTRYSRSPERTVVHHESVHFYQMMLQRDNLSTSKVYTLPPWFVEGQANLIGMTIANRGFALGQRGFEIGRLKNVIPEAGSMDSRQWLEKLNWLDTQQGFIFQNELGYSLGWLALEPVYQTFGIQKKHDLLVAVNKGQTFDEAVESILGTTKTNLYEQIAAYLAQEVN